jgi:hypothetical protein
LRVKNQPDRRAEARTLEERARPHERTG